MGDGLLRIGTKWDRMVPNGPKPAKWYRIVPNVVEGTECQLILNGAEWCQIVPNSAALYRMVANGTKQHLTVLNSAEHY